MQAIIKIPISTGKTFSIKSNMAQIIKQAQKMQEDMKRKQQEIEEKEYEASSAGGAVKVLLSGKKEIKKI